jgi:hypothetical protein
MSHIIKSSLIFASYVAVNCPCKQNLNQKTPSTNLCFKMSRYQPSAGYFDTDRSNKSTNVGLPSRFRRANNQSKPFCNIKPDFQASSSSGSYSLNLPSQSPYSPYRTGRFTQHSTGSRSSCPQLIDATKGGDKSRKNDHLSSRLQGKKRKVAERRASVSKRRRLGRGSVAITETGTPPKPLQFLVSNMQIRAPPPAWSPSLIDQSQISQMSASLLDFCTPPNQQWDSDSATTENSSTKSGWSSRSESPESLDSDEIPSEEDLSDHDCSVEETTEDDDECPVCLDEYDWKTRINPCGHIMCWECVEAWIKNRFAFERPGNCPVCKMVYKDTTFIEDV